MHTVPASFVILQPSHFTGSCLRFNSMQVNPLTCPRN